MVGVINASESTYEAAETVITKVADFVTGVAALSVTVTVDCVSELVTVGVPLI